MTLAPVRAKVERFAAMGTRVELHRFGPGADDALAQARRAVAAVDDALTIHRRSPVTMLNAQLLAGRRAAIDDPLLFDALVEVAAAHRRTLGLFDPAADRGTGATWGAIAFDPDGAWLEASRPLALDFGGFGKGFALDRAGAALRAAGVTSACLSAGESSLAVVGEHPLGGGWPFAVPHPLAPERSLVELELLDQSLSISATVGAGVDAPERAAMIRPSDGAIVTGACCTVAVERTGARAEAMSTALLVADVERADRLRAGAPDRRLRFCFARPSAASPSSNRMQVQ
ncbi:FAD:protein FMN transferase [Sphingomonas sp. ac-8]|uniref:FAD:protein FMN transferase n=1 Tax=Sphingomonas sp. ac-8 TaxID=3242977 RepID=UPI003A7FF7D6